MKKYMSIFAISMLVASMAGCSDDNVGTDDVDLKPITQEFYKVQQTEFAQKSNKFANKLLAVFSSQSGLENENVCVAPMSMQYMLSMAANGTRDALQEEMVGAMGFDNIDHLNAENLALLNKLSQDDQYVKAVLSNSIWIYNRMPFQTDFRNTMQQYYKAKMAEVDFDKNATAVKQQIDQWASENTDNLIKSVPIDVKNKHLVLANANCFKAKWACPFDPTKTVEKTFYNKDNSTSNVKTMLVEDAFMRYADDSLQMVELPYGKGYYSMMLVMPKYTECMDSIAENADWWGWHEKMRWGGTEVSLPRFAVSSAWNNVLDMMEDLGMPHVKGGSFSNIGGIALMEFNQMIHNVALQVDENGTKAAAVSAGNATDTATRIEKLAFNHPFIFAVRENTTGAILFMGKVVKL